MIMTAFFIAIALGEGIIFLISKGKYDEFLESLDSKTYRLKSFMPMALFLLEKVGYTYNTRYDQKLYPKIAELYGFRAARYYLKVHWVNKLAFLLLGLLIVGFLGAAMGEVDFVGSVFFILVLAGILIAPDYELNERIKKRHDNITMEFPDFTNKLILLINAGMTVPRAWEKIVSGSKKETPLYVELRIVLQDIRAGKPENTAYEDFAKRCKTPEITKFISVILQNMRKGSGELISILRLQAAECWEIRKHTAKRLGEEASTKLLVPMMLMFFAILIIVATPAVMAIKGF